MKICIVEGFPDDARPYYYFNYVDKDDGGRTNMVLIHQDHPIFLVDKKPQNIGWDQKYLLKVPTNLKSGVKIKTEYGIKSYVYDPNTVISELKRVKQCFVCSSLNPSKKDDYRDCNCSCERENFSQDHICDR